jgi:signal transduction histidine kinase
MVIASLIEWEKAIDCIDMPISVHDENHRVSLANAAFARAVKRPVEEIIGQKCHKLVHCSDEPLSECPHKQLLGSGEPVEREIVSQDESKVVGVSCYPLHDAQGKLLGSVHLVRDVTGVARLRERMERSNATVARHLEVIRTNLREFNRSIGTFKVPFAGDGLARCHEIRGCAEEDCPARTSSNLRCWHAPSTRCERDGLIDSVDRLSFCHLCEVYKNATLDDVSALTEMFNDMVYLLNDKQMQLIHSERLLLLGELSATLAHELRSPLNSLSIATQRLGRQLESGADLDKQGLSRLHEGLSRDVDRLDGVIEDFVKSVKRPMRTPEGRDLRAIVDEVAEQIRFQTDRRSISLDVCRHPEGLTLSSELSEHLRIILLNILLNALDASSRGGHIGVTCSVDEEDLLLEVTDCGSGISDDVMPRILEPFYSTKPDGTGLGLALVHWLVQRHDGKLGVMSELDRGTTITIRFPRMKRQAHYTM